MEKKPFQPSLFMSFLGITFSLYLSGAIHPIFLLLILPNLWAAYLALFPRF